MSRVVVDASAMAAVVFDEPEGNTIGRALEGQTMFAPTLLAYELANIVSTKAKRFPAEAARLTSALAAALSPASGLILRDVDPVDVALMARALGLTAYDASYVWLAASLGANLVTLDTQLIRASAVIA